MRLKTASLRAERLGMMRLRGLMPGLVDGIFLDRIAPPTIRASSSFPNLTIASRASAAGFLRRNRLLRLSLAHPVRMARPGTVWACPSPRKTVQTEGSCSPIAEACRARAHFLEIAGIE